MDTKNWTNCGLRSKRRDDGRNKWRQGDLHGAGVNGLWCRCSRTTALVKPDYGAGVVKGVGPAPQNGVLCTTVAQVPYNKSHLRHNTLSPATIPNATRAKTYFHLRQNILQPAPIPIVTCAKTYFHLRQYLLPPAPNRTSPEKTSLMDRSVWRLTG